MQSVGAVPSTFVDNWSFSATAPAILESAVSMVQMFAETWHLTIDYKKTWAWGTTRLMRECWQSFESLAEQFPDRVPVADSATELGVVRMYSKCPRPQAAHVITRMDRLGIPPLTDCGIVLIHALIVKYAMNLVNRRNKKPSTVMGRKFSMAKLLPFFGMSAARA